MATTFTVQADSAEEAEAALARLCTLLGAEPLGRVYELPGRPRWMARAQPVAEASG